MEKHVSLLEFLEILEDLSFSLDNSECPPRFNTEPYQSGYRSAVHSVRFFVRDGYLDFLDEEDNSVSYVRKENE